VSDITCTPQMKLTGKVEAETRGRDGVLRVGLESVLKRRLGCEQNRNDARIRRRWLFDIYGGFTGCASAFCFYKSNSSATFHDW
ncbi:MAG: hypothetical protein KGI37_00005, partial [Alphaproteobacteria bacterium]|nr:hypothetical protein [Alphaproteobacteria bacterium]